MGMFYSRFAFISIIKQKHAEQESLLRLVIHKNYKQPPYKLLGNFLNNKIIDAPVL